MKQKSGSLVEGVSLCLRNTCDALAVSARQKTLTECINDFCHFNEFVGANIRAECETKIHQHKLACEVGVGHRHPIAVDQRPRPSKCGFAHRLDVTNCITVTEAVMSNKTSTFFHSALLFVVVVCNSSAPGCDHQSKTRPRHRLPSVNNSDAFGCTNSLHLALLRLLRALLLKTPVVRLVA